MQMIKLTCVLLGLTAILPAYAQTDNDQKPTTTELTTKWGAAIDHANVWGEYPRPQLERDAWQCLNGEWDYAISSIDREHVPEMWRGTILVPFCLESSLGGVQRKLSEDEALWYRRTFAVDQTKGESILLNFEAVDYECWVDVNGKRVGHHKGGNTPFALNISDAVRDGENELVVRVVDATENYQLRGKQVRNPHGIWYTQVSGIWQTVWLEQVGRAWIEQLDITTDARAGSITVAAKVAGDADGTRLRVEALDGDDRVAEASGIAAGVELTVPNAKLWSPDSPNLYRLKVTLLGADGKAVDRADSYAGIRSVGTIRDADGHLRFTLNDQVIFHWGPLDQGWWPDGLLTPPSDAAMLSDIEFLKQAGFNMIRKHIKVEPRRYYYHCDRLGMMVWQDQVSAGHGPRWTRLKPNPADANWSDENHEQFMLELERMIDTLESHPSIVVWVPFNEAWGQHRTMDVGKWTVERDPTRHVNVASGGNFWPVGHIVDAHNYPQPDFPFNRGQNDRFDDFVKVVGEFGGHGFPVLGHLWETTNDNWGYGGLPQNLEEYQQRYVTTFERLEQLRKGGIAAGVYTQTTDVEREINGLLTYDRRVAKIPVQELAELHQRVLHPLKTPPSAGATAGIGPQ
jgi:beta-galactosidase